MKKVSIYIVLALALLYACVEDTNQQSHEINLITSGGERLANNIDELNKWTSEAVEEKYGKGRMFEVTKISYYNLKNGYMAIIEYQVDKTHSNSYFIVKNPLVDAQGRTQQVDCIRWSGSCQGSQCCTPSFDSGTMNYSCSCSGGGTGCTMMIRCIEESE